MRQWLQRRSLLCEAAFVAVLSILSIDVRGQAAKRPLTYDVDDSWKSIQGTRCRAMARGSRMRRRRRAKTAS